MNAYDTWLRESGAAHGPSGAPRPAWADDINLAEKRGHRLRPVYAPGRKTLVCENCGAGARSSELGIDCPKRGECR